MQSHESSEPVRFTPAQRDALLELAARLQSEHEASIDAQELARAAAEAGIDPRFLHEAALRMQTQPNEAMVGRNDVDRRIAVASVVTLVVVDTLLFLVRPHGYVSKEYMLLMGVTSLCASVLIARFRPMRFLAPLLMAATWMAVGISTVFINRITQGYIDYDFPRFVVLSGFLQLVVSAIVTGIVAAVDRTPNRR